MLRILLLCVVACWTSAQGPNAIGQSVPSDEVPEGLSAADWSSIKAAYVAARHGAQPMQDGDWSRQDENGASYSLTSGGIAQQAYLKASNTGPNDQFGWSVAVSGDTVVVGAPWEDSNATGVNGDQGDDSATKSGAAYVFVRNGTSWSQQAYLKASNTDAGDEFGFSVAVSEDTVVVGAYAEDSNATGVNGDQANDSATTSGAAYVFVRSGTNWSQQAYLKASNSDLFDYFGHSVSVSGNTVVIGAIGEGSNATGVNGDQTNDSLSLAGATYVFVPSGTTWTQQAYLKPSNPDSFDRFGWSVSVSSDTVVVGARLEASSATGVNGDQTIDGFSHAGAAYVFARSGTSWSQEAYLKASNTDAGDEFGFSVAVSGNTVVVGANQEASSATGVDGDQSDNSAQVSGAAYVFVRSGTTWNQQAYLKASNTDQNDHFGESVAVLGDLVVVGAWSEDSNATGVNGDQSSLLAGDSGAAYVFVRSGSNWSQQAYLKASNTGSGDRFGRSVAVSDDLVVAGAWREKSSATGVNGDQGDSGNQTGAAYVFGTTAWIDQGCALAGLLGDPLLVGTGTLAAGSNNSVDLSNAAPSATCGLFVALSSTPTPFKGGTLKPVPIVLGPIILTTSSAGAVPLSFTMPPGIPSATELWVQYVVQDAAAIQGFSLSNALVGTTP